MYKSDKAMEWAMNAGWLQIHLAAGANKPIAPRSVWLLLLASPPHLSTCQRTDTSSHLPQSWYTSSPSRLPTHPSLIPILSSCSLCYNTTLIRKPLL